MKRIQTLTDEQLADLRESGAVITPKKVLPKKQVDFEPEKPVVPDTSREEIQELKRQLAELAIPKKVSRNLTVKLERDKNGLVSEGTFEDPETGMQCCVKFKRGEDNLLQQFTVSEQNG